MNSNLRQIILLLIPGVLLMLLSCNGNRLKTDEKKLTEEILQKEKEAEEAERKSGEDGLSDTLKKLPPGFRFKEERSVDPSRPPVVVDIEGSLNNTREYKLSDVASKITYIRMQKIPDTGFSIVRKFKYYLMDKNIIAISPSGILLYTRDGKYLSTIVKNEFTGIDVTEKMIVVRPDNTFIGGGYTVWAQGNMLYYKYRNSLTGQSYIMEYDCSRVSISLTTGFDPEKPRQIRALGDIAVNLNPGNKKPAMQKGSANGMWSAGYEFFYKGTGTILLDQNTYAKPLGNEFMLGGNSMMGIFDKKGDTLATFTQFEKLETFSKSVMRGTDQGTQYENKGKLFFRNAFNDTVFQVIPPNRLLPVYIIKLGKYQLLKKEGMDPDFNLTGKIIPGTWADTRNFIFLSFTKDSYDCYNTRKSKQLKLYFALFEKSSRKLFIVKGDPHNYDEEILMNNIDGGLPVWPSSYMTGNNGEIMISLKGKELKERIKSEQFKRSAAPASKKNELIKLASSVADSEDILMIVE
ncbi:MAG: DUF4933 domain-containing protein [Bacteroidetes bacterium]|nr:DUF4933 domain-containing protein [Bacteroidota bacterium]